MQDLVNFLSNHAALTAAMSIVVVLLFVVEFMRAKRATFNITPAQATQKINRDNAVVIDMRSNEAFRKGHIIDAISMTMDDLKKNPKKLDKYRNKPLILVCNLGNESQKMAPTLIKQGFNTYSIAGGIRAWSDAQMPLIKE